jgi:hypothetical protein
MGHQIGPHQVEAWRSADGERAWWSMLIGTMEQVSRPEIRERPCDSKILSALRLQLALPAAPYPHWQPQQRSDFSLRN